MKYVLILCFIGLFPSAALAYTADDFVITVDTSLPGSASDTFVLPTFGSGYDAVVDWGDGATTSLSGAPGNVPHTYATSGIKEIVITHNTPNGFPQIFFNNSGDRQKILTIEQWGTTQWRDMRAAFMGCTNLTVPASDAPDLSNVLDLSYMFSLASTMNESINNWDVSNITYMAQMFLGATSFNQPLDNWDVSNVTDMSYMFREASSFNQDLSNWSLGSNIFYGEGTGVTGMFFDTPFNHPSIATWDVSQTPSLGGLFYGAADFNQDISMWDVSDVPDFSNLFYEATSFNQPLNTWTMTSAENLSYTFGGAVSFNQPLDNWDVSGVQRMDGMFVDTSSFNQDLSSWNISSLAHAGNMFAGSSLSKENYSKLLTDWSLLPLQTVYLGQVGGTFNSGISNYENLLSYCTSAEAARDILTGTYSWTIADGGPTDCTTSEVSGGNQSTAVGVRRERMETLKDAVASTTAPVTATVSTFVTTLKNLLTYLTTHEAELRELTPAESKSLIIVLRDALLRLLSLLPGV